MKKVLLTALMAISSLVSAQAEIHVLVSIRNQTAWLLDDSRILLTSPVSTARRGMHTPTGEFEVSEKDTWHISTIYHVSMPITCASAESRSVCTRVACRVIPLVMVASVCRRIKRLCFLRASTSVLRCGLSVTKPRASPLISEWFNCLIQRTASSSFAGLPGVGVAVPGSAGTSP
jgi:L,D-transpeptidase catalytic domain